MKTRFTSPAPNLLLPAIAILFAASASAFTAFPATAQLAGTTQTVNFAATTAPVGHTSDGALITPINQIVTPAGTLIELPGTRLQTLALSPDGKILAAAGLALSPDGKKLYAALNLSNRLAELDAASGRLLRLWDTGVAPYDVVLVKNKLYVSNWGGRRPDPGATATSANPAGPAGRGTTVRIDARGVASEGSLTVIDLAQTPSSSAQKELPIGRHATALALSPDARWLAAAATADDTIYIIDTRTDQIAEKICARPNPSDLFGAQPAALAFSPDGKTLYAANATQNAIAVFRFDPADKESAFLGLIPTGWFPSGLVYDAKHNQLCVANTKDIATQPAKAGLGAKGTGFNTKQFVGSLSLIPLADVAKNLPAHTARALANLRYPLLAQAALPPRPGIAPAPVPERVDEPSVFKHVIYIIKENRSYDQVLGDVKTGNGAPDLCIFGEKVTPNQHKLVREFVLLDNTYCSGILSAEGHHWTDSAIAVDYIERQHTAAWPRSYPGGGSSGGGDALAYAPTGFIWDNALAHGKTVINFGEFCSVSPQTLERPRPQRQNRLARKLPRLPQGRQRHRIRLHPQHRIPAPHHRPHLHRLGPDPARRLARAPLRPRPQAIRTKRQPLQPHYPLDTQRPHWRHESRPPRPRVDGRRQRPRRGPNPRSPQPQQILERHLPLRHRGRPAERLGPRQRLPHHRLHRQPLHQTRHDHQHPIQPNQHPAHH